MSERWATAWWGLAAVLLAGCAAAPPEQETAAQQRDVEVRYEGNADLPDFRLTRVVEDLLIDFGRDPTYDAPILDASVDLRDRYRQLGYPDAEVDYRIDRPAAGAPIVTFVVREGPAVVIEDLRIEGNERLSDEELLPLWRRTHSGLLGQGPPFLVDAELAAFALAIRERYAALGYLDAAVEGPVVDREPGAETARVLLRVREGEGYVFGAVDVAPELLAVAAAERAAALPGSAFDGLAVRDARQELRDLLQNSGYPSPEVRARLEVDRDRRRVDVRIAGRPGPRARVADVVVEGRERTTEFVVRSLLVIERDAWYDARTVERSVAALYRTGLFRRVEAELRPRGEDVVVAIVLEEAEVRQVSFLLGYGSYELLRGGVYLSDDNLFGLGHRFQIGGRASFKSYGTDATWTDPNVLFSGFDLTTTGFYRIREEPSFTDLSSGFSASLSRELLSQLTGRLGYALESRDGRDIDPALLVGVAPDFQLGEVFAELVHDRRDSPLFPRAGHLQSVKYEFADDALGGDVSFERLTAELGFYVPLGERATFGVSAEAGWIWPDDGPVPVQERFFNGGQNTVRSFREARLGPLTPSGTPAGGEFHNVFSAELRFPIVGVLDGALFGDAGNVGVDVDRYGLDDLRYAVGAGLRLVLPIGPVRFDVGWNPDRRDGERVYTLHVAVGYPF